MSSIRAGVIWEAVWSHLHSFDLEIDDEPGMLAEIDAVLADERRSAVERIRTALHGSERRVADFGDFALDDEAVTAILDAEAAR